MDEWKPVLRLMIAIQIFLLFACLSLPVLVREMQGPIGKWAYAIFAILCVFQALLLRRALAKLD